MCDYCGHYPCDPRCPNAPDPSPTYICDWCNDPQFEDVYYDLDGAKVCPDCIEKARRFINAND